MIYNNILETIGNTPIVRLNRMAPAGVEMYVKVESFNPMASVKDRLAYAIITDAETRGTLKPGQTVVEATSGNTGIALAMVCAAKGHQFVATMADSFSIERRKIMRGLGAKVILTPAAERGTGMVKKAEELAEKHGWFLARQFQNPANPEFHRQTTGPEILRDFAGKRLDYWVTGYGTGGTMTGVGEVSESRQTRGQDRGDRAQRERSCLRVKNGARTRFRAGLRTSSPRFSIATSSTNWCRLPTTSRSPYLVSWRRKKAYSPASPAAQRLPRRSRSPGRRRKGR